MHAMPLRLGRWSVCNQEPPGSCAGASEGAGGVTLIESKLLSRRSSPHRSANTCAVGV